MGKLRDLLTPDPTCGACGRSYSKGRSCLRCKNVQRGHDRKTKREQGVDPSPRPCPNGCGRTMRGGVCPGANC